MRGRQCKTKMMSPCYVASQRIQELLFKVEQEKESIIRVRMG